MPLRISRFLALPVLICPLPRSPSSDDVDADEAEDSVPLSSASGSSDKSQPDGGGKDNAGLRTRGSCGDKASSGLTGDGASLPGGSPSSSLTDSGDGDCRCFGLGDLGLGDLLQTQRSVRLTPTRECTEHTFCLSQAIQEKASAFFFCFLLVTLLF